ncbi:hypothetical protein V6Z77_010193 [Aspergillus fumigatus]
MLPRGHVGIREADGHVGVAASVPADGARLSGADKGARAGQLVTSGASRVRLGVSRPGVGPWRAPANWSPPVPASVSLGQRLSRRAPCLPAAGLPKGLPPTGHPLPPVRRPPPPPRQLGQLTGRCALACAPPPPPPPRPPRPPRPPFAPSARDSARLEGAAYRAPSPSTDSPRTPVRRRPFSYTSTDLARPIIVGKCPGPERCSWEGAYCRDRARPCGMPQPTGHCPSSLSGGGGAGPRGHLGRPTGESHGDPEGTGRHRAPALRRKVSGPSALALPGPLMGGFANKSSQGSG